MRLRQTRPEDLTTALGFIPDSYGYDTRLRPRLPALWADMLRKGQLGSGVVEDMSRPAEERVRGVGLSVFVEDSFADQELANPRPNLNARLMELVASGNSPVLDRRRIAAGNAGSGLTLMPLHFATPRFDDVDPEVSRTLAAGHELLRLVHAGHRIRRIFKEVAGINLARFLVSTGMRIHTDFAAAPDFAGSRQPADRPYLMAAEGAALPVGSALWLMLMGAEPRFGLSPAEQKVLFSALLHETDEEIAEELCISPETLGKHWRSIYNRILTVDPEFFPITDERPGRGRGKRHRLLRYIRNHMEELRPWPRRQIATRPGEAVRLDRVRGGRPHNSADAASSPPPLRALPD